MSSLSVTSDDYEYRFVEWRNFEKESVQEKLDLLVSEGWEIVGDQYAKAGYSVDLNVQDLRRPLKKLKGAAKGLLANVKIDVSEPEELCFLSSSPENTTRLNNSILELEGLKGPLLAAANKAAEELGVTLEKFIEDAILERISLHNGIFDEASLEDLVGDMRADNLPELKDL